MYLRFCRYVCAAMSSLSSILLGIDVGVMSGAKVFLLLLPYFLYHPMVMFSVNAPSNSLLPAIYPQEYMTPDLGLNTVQEEVMKHMQSSCLYFWTRSQPTVVQSLLWGSLMSLLHLELLWLVGLYNHLWYCFFLTWWNLKLSLSSIFTILFVHV